MLETIHGSRHARLSDMKRDIRHLEPLRIEMPQGAPKFETRQATAMDHDQDDVAARTRTKADAGKAVLVVPVVEQGNLLLPPAVEREQDHAVAEAPLDERVDGDLSSEDFTLARLEPLPNRGEYRLFVGAEPPRRPADQLAQAGQQRAEVRHHGEKGPPPVAANDA